MKQKRKSRKLVLAAGPTEVRGAEQAVLEGPLTESPPQSIGQWQRFRQILASPVSGASLAAFRVAVGVIMALEAYTLCRPSASTSGQSALAAFYTGPDIKFWFPYPGFAWLPILSAPWLYAVVALQALAGFTMAIGLFYRASAITVFLSWAYLYAIESTRTYWMSYYYLELLVSFLMIWMPAARCYSLDARRARDSRSQGWVPSWTILLLRAQLVITYFYAGAAKLNRDWLLDAQPVRYFLAKSRFVADYGAHLSSAQLEAAKNLLHSNQFAYFISYAGAAFDLSVGFLLLARRTRFFGLVLLCLFHGLNHFVLFNDIEWFPLLGIVTASIFLAPDWPERCRHWLRRPHWTEPDWRWFTLGGLLLPVVGAALGWKASADRALARPQPGTLAGRWAAPFVAVWIVWQTLVPLRPYWIPGDARFTWEGLSFSWRLKAEVYRSTPCTLVVDDPKIVTRDPSGPARIDWSQWHGDRAIYRAVSPNTLDWSALPEILVLLEPITGERILYNPLSSSRPTGAPPDARDRVKQIWQELYRRSPQAVEPTMSLAELLRPFSTRLRSRGYAMRSVRDVLNGTEQTEGRPGAEQVNRALRQAPPFALAGQPASPLTPFFVIEDPQLVRQTGTAQARIDPHAWISGPATQVSRGPAVVNVGAAPVIVYTTELGVAARDLLPLASIRDSLDQPDQPAQIVWNYLNELPNSKGMHISMQPFLLRQYARHIARFWQEQYGRRAAVRANTAVSLNGRSFQPLVDPEADLASVPAAWFRHNAWVRNLEAPRIPHTGSELLTP